MAVGCRRPLRFVCTACSGPALAWFGTDHDGRETRTTTLRSRGADPHGDRRTPNFGPATNRSGRTNELIQSDDGETSSTGTGRSIPRSAMPVIRSVERALRDADDFNQGGAMCAFRPRGITPLTTGIAVVTAPTSKR